MVRKGLGKGKGKGYKNIQGRDPKIHSDSSKGRKQPQFITHIPKPKPKKYTNGKIYPQQMSELYDRWEHEIIYDVATDTIDNLYPTESYETYDVIKFVDESLKDFKAYQDTFRYGDENYIVKDIKGRGYPDYDDVMQKVAKELNMEVDDVKKQFDSERFDSLFWDDLNFEIENITDDEYLNLDKDEFAVVGRSGGYWGIKFSSGIVEFNKRKGREKIKEAFKEQKEEILEQLKKLDEEERFLFDSKADFIYQVSQQLKWSPEEEDIDDMIQLTDEYITKFHRVNEFIEGTIKDYESSDRWVDTIIRNEYIEKPLTAFEKAQQEPSQTKLNK